MYCIKCGVELQEGAARCPLCGLKVYHPEIKETPAPGPYPRYTEEDLHVKRLFVPFVLMVIFLIPLVICLLVDLKLNGGIVWSGYVAFGLLTLWVTVCLPLFFRNRNPVIFFPIQGAAVLLLTLYICLKTGGHWFLSLSFPVGGALILIIETVIVLLRYVIPRGDYRILYVLGGAVTAVGLLCILIEFLIHVTFRVPMQWWCLYPVAVLGLLGLSMILTAIFPSLRSALHKKFFI